MKKIRTLISSSTILPSLFISSVVNLQSAVAGPVGPGQIVIAQAATTPNEEEIRRRLEQEKLKQRHEPGTPPAAIVPHQAPPPVHVTPVEQVKPPTPPAPVAPVPVTPHVVTPPPAPPAAIQQKPAIIAPAPNRVIPTEPPPRVVTPTQPAVVPHAVVPVQPQTPAPGAANPGPTHVVPLPGAPVNPQFKPATPQSGVQPKPGVPNAANGPSTMAPQFPAQPQQAQQPKRAGITPLEGVAIGAAAGIVGGMIIGQQVHGLNEVQSSRREVEQNGATFYSEPGRVIVREGDGLYVRHDETERFREFGSDVRVEQRGDQTVQIVDRPDGSKIITITDSNGQLLKRLRRLPNGIEVVLIDNSFRPRPRHFSDEIVTIAPPPMTLPADQYDLDAGTADEGQIYETLAAPPLANLPRRYTLDEVRYSRDLRQYMRSVELNSITFSTGSWALEDSEIGNLKGMADAINRAIRANPNEIFLVEGHTDAVGSDVDNLSLSDRRAQTVAGILTRSFNVPPENLTTQGYGSQFLKIQTDGPERANRRVTIRRVTPLLAGSNGR